MRASDVLREFASKLEGPIDVNDVLKFINAGGIECDVEFFEVELDTNILLGKIRTYYSHSVPYGDPTLCANIYYAKQMSREWHRLVCCKELMHILDPDGHKATTPEQIHYNAERIGLPSELRDISADGRITNSDRIAEFYALGILFPLAARDVLMNHYENGKISIDDIARLYDLPKRKAAIVMTPLWADIHSMLLEFP